MKVHVTSSRTAAAAAVTGLLLCTSLAAADAAGTAKAASAPRTISSANWGAVATTRTSAPYGTGSLTLRFSNTGKDISLVDENKYFTVGNTGILGITGATYTATASPSTLTLKIEACSGAWNESADSCTGSVSTVLQTPASNIVSSTVPTGAGTAIRLRAGITGLVPPHTTPTVIIGVNVTREQARAATTTGG